MESLREAKKAQTKKSLIDKAQLLFNENGVEGIGIRDLAKESGVGLGTYYNYFKTKDEIIFSIADKIFSHLFTSCLKDIEFSSKDSTVEKLNNLVIYLLENLSRNREVVVQLVQIISITKHYIDSESEGRKFTERHIINYSSLVSSILGDVTLRIERADFGRLCWHQFMIFIYMWFMDQTKNHVATKEFINSTHITLIYGALLESE